MDIKTLEHFGLNKTQAKAYLALIRNGSLTPPALAKLTGETRTNAYTVLDRLVELGLAKKTEKNKKFVYHVENPVALEKLAVKHRTEALQREKQVKDAMPALLNFFYTFSEQPGVRFFQGVDGVQQIFDDQLRTRKPVTFIRSTADAKLYGYETMRKTRSQFAKLGITRKTFSPDAADIPRRWQETDKERLLERTFMRETDYTAPVEWSVYGDKLAITSFGEEVIGMIIESQQIANAFRQILDIMDEGLRARPDYDELPKLAKTEV